LPSSSKLPFPDRCRNPGDEFPLPQQSERMTRRLTTMTKE
jgi:hypothetical protein